MSAELRLLCQSCGLCCDGSLFGRVDLEPDELYTARRRRLRVLPDGRAFEQPCSALRSVESDPSLRTCSLYDERPAACRRFVCALYERHRAEGGPIDARLDEVRRVRALVASLEAAGLTAADFERAREAREPVDPRVRAALPAYLEAMDRLGRDFVRAKRAGDGDRDP